MVQLHKRFTDSQVKELIERHRSKGIERGYIQEVLGIGKTRFFALVNAYRHSPLEFSIQYERNSKTRTIPQVVEDNIVRELQIERTMIENPEIPLRHYNYSYIRDLLRETHHQKVSLSTIIDRAKKHGFSVKRKPQKEPHDREVLTKYAGELIQHDSSHHLWSPPAKEKWYLITSLDDFSRFLLYATLVKRETAWTHILALQTVVLKHGASFLYYVDSHSIFRFVQGKDSLWRKHYTLTDEADSQWKQVMNDCNIKVTYALSPQARGKIERPYGWLQDRLVRTCVREDVTDIREAQQVLAREVARYNYRQVHSTTQEVPYFRFQRALEEKQSLFREFQVKPPFQSVKDIFCLRVERTVDSYRKISLHNLQLKVNNAIPRKRVTLRIYPLNKGVSEIRFWCDDTLIDIQRIKNSDLKGVHF
jgi:hypothetical protein